MDMGAVADRASLTPAERAVMVEQAESMKVQLDEFIAHCKDGTPGEAIRAFSNSTRHAEYITGMVQQKLMDVLHADHSQGHHGHEG